MLKGLLKRVPACPDLRLIAIPAFTFFDPNDPACQEILFDPQTTIPELFAIVRQWVPQVQHKIDVIGNEVGKLGKLDRQGGCHPPTFQ